MREVDRLIADSMRKIYELHCELEDGTRIPTEIELDLAIENRFLDELLYDERFYDE